MQKAAKGAVKKVAKAVSKQPTLTNQQFIQKDLKYVAHNYSPLPVTITKGKGMFLYDVEGNRYFDLHSGYSSTNQGHSHPKILKALIEQSKKLTQTSRAFYNDQLGETSEYLCKLLGFDKMLPMNSGAEAVETAIKLARRWAYAKKGIPDNSADIILAKGNFHGRTITLSGASDDPLRYTGFGPFTPGFQLVDYNNADQIEKALSYNNNVAAVLLEPIQGEMGVIVPD